MQFHKRRPLWEQNARHRYAASTKLNVFQCSDTQCTYLSQRKSNPARKIQKLCPKRVRRSKTMHNRLVIVGPRARIRLHYLRLCMDNKLGREVLVAIFSEYRTRCISATSPGFTHSRSVSFIYYTDLSPTITWSIILAFEPKTPKTSLSSASLFSQKFVCISNSQQARYIPVTEVFCQVFHVIFQVLPMHVPCLIYLLSFGSCRHRFRT